MIIEYLINFIMLPVILILNLMPDLPDLPTAIVDGGNWVFQQFGVAIAILHMFLGTTFVNAVIVVVLAIVNFNWLYNLSMWVLRKTPFINVS